MYVVCAIVAAFAVVALGWGPFVFGATGVAVAVGAFRQRRRRWWGLPGAAAGLVVAVGAPSGWRVSTVALAALSLFGVVVALRVAVARTAPRPT